jgi:uncharacterized protein YjbI with pentapeptide repeats
MGRLRPRDPRTIDAGGKTIQPADLERMLARARGLGDGKALIRGANFKGATLADEVHFDDVTFECGCDFRNATFQGPAYFADAVFNGEAQFQRARFAKEAHFPKADFRGDAVFHDATFAGFAHFPDATFNGEANFRGADLKAGFRLGPCRVAGRLELENASLGDVDMRVCPRLLSCRGTHFHGTAQLKVCGAELELDQCVFDKPSALAQWEDLDPEHNDDGPAMPRLVSLRGADVGSLTLANVDLSTCEYKSTLRLDELRLATRCPFDEAPAGRLFVGRSFPFLWRWTKRLTIHEERRWRRSTPKRQGWGDRPVSPRNEKRGVADRSASRSEAERLAKTYRALRKGREDEGDAPGAGDFYYGEMEMRRHGQGSPAERAIIWLYWLVSGYGLRASRALVALGVTVLLFAGLFSALDIRGQESFLSDLVFSLQSTTSLLRAPAEELPTGGQFLEVGLRLLGPLFFGLALLSLRGRVKR